LSGISPARPLRAFRLYWSMVRYGRAHNRDFAREHFAFFDEMRRRLAGYVGELAGLRVLDVGCGKSMWLTLLLQSAGAQVTGIDTEAVTALRGLRKYNSIVKNNGVERALRTVAWDILFARPYYKHLEEACGFPLLFEGLDVRRMSAQELDFDDDTFDLVVSHEVFEHLPDLDATVESIQRVMKPTGITYIYTHNYASISGGHHIAWKYPDSEPSETVPPWDHLRENRFPDIPSWLNRLRERDYREAFGKSFDIAEWLHTTREGEKLLTPDIQAELAEFSADELLTKGFVTIARPRKVGAALLNAAEESHGA